MTFTLPEVLGASWTLEVTTDPDGDRILGGDGASLPLAGRSIAVLRQG